MGETCISGGALALFTAMAGTLTTTISVLFWKLMSVLAEQAKATRQDRDDWIKRYNDAQFLAAEGQQVAGQAVERIPRPSGGRR